jgi:hypothetical protein
VKSTKWGEVYRPTLKPADLSIEHIREEVDPFPLVPAT